MKGKIAFVLGAAVGYVLGTRAGRERYEQIKRGAAAVWSTEPVQRGVALVRDAVDERADEVMTFVRRASADAFSNYSKRADDKRREKRAAQTAADAAERASAAAETAAAAVEAAGAAAPKASPEPAAKAPKRSAKTTEKAAEAEA